MFINEKRSGRKNGNLIVIASKETKIGDLPISLRSFTVFYLDNYKDNLLKYIRHLAGGIS